MARRTGPDRATRQDVLWRDAQKCIRCGLFLHELKPYHLHHRRPRGMGGTDNTDANSPANLLSLCVDCHVYIESNRAEAYSCGWLVSQFADPQQVPCLVEERSRWVHLTADGRYSDNPVVAA